MPDFKPGNKCYFLFQKSQYRRTETCVEFQIAKTANETWPRLTEQSVKLPWLKIDFDKFMVEGETEDEGGAGVMKTHYSFSNFQHTIR